jgi:hypothetical protein
MHFCMLVSYDFFKILHICCNYIIVCSFQSLVSKRIIRGENLLKIPILLPRYFASGSVGVCILLKAHQVSL